MVVCNTLRCGEIFCDGIIANFLLIMTVKEFQKLVNIWFSGPPCTLHLKNDTDVAYDNFNAHQPILVFFGRDIAE